MEVTPAETRQIAPLMRDENWWPLDNFFVRDGFHDVLQKQLRGQMKNLDEGFHLV